MGGRPVTVLGGGVAGLATALLLARDGHRVSLLERDDVRVGPPDEAFGWERRGIPHFLQPHAFIPRGCAELGAHYADVYAVLLRAGACEVDLRAKIPGALQPGDEQLRYLAVRRPLIEWALRRSVAAEPRITVRAQTRATGLEIVGGGVRGVRVGGSLHEADVVVDALGRRSASGQWLTECGAARPPVETGPCAVTYYARYYRQRAGFELPDGPWLVSPRGDLGYLAYATFPGDNRTFAALLAVPPGVPEWRSLKDPSVFEAAVATIPALRSWVDPEGVVPITGVMPMAGLRNTFRPHDSTQPRGFVRVGDALCHLDPVLAHGLAFALIHAAELAAALREHDDVDDAAALFVRRVEPELRERYEFATALDEQRYRMWLGGPVDFTCPGGDYALFTMAAGAAAALVDPDVFRVFVRRTGLLDRTAVLDDDVEMQQRIEQVFAVVRTVPRQRPGPGRDELVALAAADLS